MGTFQASNRTIQLKLVYCGPPGSGKHTNLDRVQHVIAPERVVGEVELDEGGGRALLAQSDPILLAVPEPCYLMVDVWTVSGEVDDNTTWRAVLQDVDGVVFVAGAERANLRANLVGYADFLSHVRSLGRDLKQLPIVFQINKTDAPDGLPTEDNEASINSEGFPTFEASVQTWRADQATNRQARMRARPRRVGTGRYSTVTLLARFRGWSTSVPLSTATW